MKIRSLEEHIRAAFELVSDKTCFRNTGQRRKELEITRMLEVLKRRFLINSNRPSN